MKILLCNDDGYTSPGIKVLSNIMSAFGDITVVAPKYHQSAMSTAVSLGLKKLVTKKVEPLGPGEWYYLDATPASCVKFGLEYMYPDRNPDLVVSGINHGSNSATAVNYSATMGCAEEAAINGLKSIGVSLCDYRVGADFSAIEALLPGIIRKLLENWPEDRPGTYYNINFPKCPLGEIKGIRVSRTGHAHWIREFAEWDSSKLQYDGINDHAFWKKVDTPIEEGEKGYYMVGDFVNDDDDPETADHLLNDAGYVTITPLKVDYTDYDELERLKTIFK